MNALVPQVDKNALASYGGADPFATAGQDMGGSNAVYLKFNGTNGDYTFGQNAEELPAKTRLAVNMDSFKRGWICWKESAVVDEIMVSVLSGQRPPLKTELADHGPYDQSEDSNDGWSEQASVELREIDGDLRTFMFKVSSKSALRALGTLLQEYGRLYKSKPGKLAIIELDNSSFMPKVKKWGKKYAPRLPIVDWLNEADLMSATGDNAADYDQDDAGDDSVMGDAAEAFATPAAPAPAPAAAPAPARAPAAPAATGGPRRRNF